MSGYALLSRIVLQSHRLWLIQRRYVWDLVALLAPIGDARRMLMSVSESRVEGADLDFFCCGIGDGSFDDAVVGDDDSAYWS